MKNAVLGYSICLLTLVGCAAMDGGWTRTELYLGLTRPTGADVTEAELKTFLDEVVTPRFPAGFTVVNAEGRWREESGRVRVEPSRVLVIFRQAGAESERKIEEIRTTYKTRFNQEAVLRVDDAEKVSF